MSAEPPASFWPGGPARSATEMSVMTGLPVPALTATWNAQNSF
jgi:hypothetical protein